MAATKKRDNTQGLSDGFRTVKFLTLQINDRSWRTDEVKWSKCFVRNGGSPALKNLPAQYGDNIKVRRGDTGGW